MIKLISSDLDGTILKNGAQELPAGFCDIVKRLKEKGIQFAAASGRQYYNLRLLFDPVKDDIHYIAENGSLCVCHNQVISKGLIERDLGFRIFKAVRERGGCHCLLSCESACYTDSKDPAFIRHILDVVRYDMRIVDRLEEITEPFLKIAVCDFSGTDNIMAYFQKMFEAEIKVVTSGMIWIDFIAPNANKGTALANLAEHLGVMPEECMAFGDQYNDVEMLKFAGTSYAMADCAPGISQYSTDVTDSVEDVLKRL
ncbi:Cof-type HAD-IIB family hydrolase [Lachnospiraceae bacterium WCA-9-b2]|jgi:Cof subfamily protein (haloacid dehalogenase superfamily)|uniref:Cof-type HAD-IIB family hydrolase n=1 Tax=Sporofaciens musculi TaxID=2681861 RepID=A0A7X3SI83_9FIRM|nr:HAD family hydrolase [Sporofaciens musculi]MCI9422441.1 HAD family hydrolase [Dorea sp.]MXP74876.1 Cof-type HAD-IIB family hydrolase [Sporofaciens musculi]